MIIGEANFIWIVALEILKFWLVGRTLKSADIEPRDMSAFFISTTRAFTLGWCR